ncbi:UDP-glucose--hexose-1-phosphate uridylyltransferase [Lactobacillus sp. ESL0791]|uniref:UDP-glucose--hexose-1-phosphate uridylyltransferase n=1 Tax=Lactobacillus sp. ESL0791 TaxID=2983234 RepID=UPI0023F69C44|nr:UDP-glucose--hexose-1-phosphate uridylyltransferase [Lactobacillus sp. ESL0791]MDF7639641.1 UDP-glucose--hexose-1-phosphate uridylyltransferase [Lactobacillus sp. ESL0791]
MAKFNLVDQFISQVISQSDYAELDRRYLVNYVLRLVGDEARQLQTSKTDLLELKDELVKAAQDNGKCGTTNDEAEILASQLMELIVPRPSLVNQRFWQTYQKNPKQAISDFYALSRRSNYIKTKAIAKNIYFVTPSDYGDLEITINLSKPEKDPKQIALAKKKKPTGYPLCQLCMENEGYLGRIGYPARSNHRIIRFKIGDQTWGFQYSPYAYFNEHCIFLAEKHAAMKINRATFTRLLAIVEQFPGYFVGSNADLPIVGGSILIHEHYQGGRHVFAMEKAPVQTKLHFADFPEVKAGIVHWPLSVIRLQSKNQEQLVNLADRILQKWQSYSDERVDVRAFTDNEPHHTVTPIARRRREALELDLVLRDNQTSAKYPDGIFHPHKDVQHIKKENIGLIEVMGLAILPPRLQPEMQEVKKYLLGQANKIASIHLPWAQQIKRKQQVTSSNVDQILQAEIGKVFVRVLEDAGVFKQTPEGQAAFMRFVQSVGR